MASQIIGNVTAALVLKSGAKQSTLFMLFAILAIVGSMLFCMLRTPKRLHSMSESEQKVHDLTAHSNKNSYTSGPPALEDSSDEGENPNSSPIQDIKDTFNLMISPRMLWTVPCQIYSA